MPTIKINDKDYDTDSLSQEATAQLEMLLAAEGEIRRKPGQLSCSPPASAPIRAAA